MIILVIVKSLKMSMRTLALPRAHGEYVNSSNSDI